MERSVFSWQSWDEQDVGAFTFCDCVFLKDFGPWKAGFTAQFVYVDYQRGVMASYNNGNEEMKCNIGLVALPNYT